MARIVTKFRYYSSNSKKKIGGYIKYIATRENVEKNDDSKQYANATYNQKQLIEKILRDFPDSKNMLEYEDYLANPIRKTASEFITRAMEDNVGNPILNQKTYADYIATRPNVEKNGDHGLFTNTDEEIILSKVSKELNEHEGNIWTMIVSLRREDAERLGFGKGARWKDLLRNHTEELSEALRIPLTNLKWYAAFHNESHHPHIHLVAYSQDSVEGYLSKNGVEKLRSSLANEIFSQEMYESFEKQTEYRDTLKRDWKKLIENIIEKANRGMFEDEEIVNKLRELGQRLSKTKQKKVYGYLKPELKRMVDDIADMLSKNQDISTLYELWCEERNKIFKIYSNDEKQHPPLSENKEFKSIKNEIIREAMNFYYEESKSRKESKEQGNKHTSSHEKRQTAHIKATAVSRLFKSLASIFKENFDKPDRVKSQIDRRQKREIEDKKNAQISQV